MLMKILKQMDTILFPSKGRPVTLLIYNAITECQMRNLSKGSLHKRYCVEWTTCNKSSQNMLQSLLLTKHDIPLYSLLSVNATTFIKSKKYRDLQRNWMGNVDSSSNEFLLKILWIILCWMKCLEVLITSGEVMSETTVSKECFLLINVNKRKRVLDEISLNFNVSWKDTKLSN